jgi:hypothetical protein
VSLLIKLDFRALKSNRPKKASKRLRAFSALNDFSCMSTFILDADRNAMQRMRLREISVLSGVE